MRCEKSKYTTVKALQSCGFETIASGDSHNDLAMIEASKAATKDGEFYAHLHMSAGDTEGRVLGGHLNEAVISATCELVLEIMDGTVERRFDPETGLNLMEF